MTKISVDKIFSIGLALALTIQFVGKQYIGMTLGILALMAIGLGLANLKKVSFHDFRQWVTAETVSLAILFICWCASSYFAINRSDSLTETLEFAGMGLGGIFVYTAIARYGFDWGLFLKALITIASVMSVLAVSHIYTRMLPEDWGSSSYSSVLAILYPVILYGVMKQIHQPILRYGVLFIVTAAIFALGGRTGYVVFLCQLTILLIAFPFSAYAHKLYGRVAVLMSALIGMGVGLHAYRTYVGEFLYQARLATINMDRPASGRLEIWQDTMARYMERPWFGLGVDGYRELNIFKSDGAHIVHPHNLIIELLIDTGIVGLIAFLSVIAVFTWKFVSTFWRQRKEGYTLYLCIFLSLVGYGLASMALTSIFHSWWFLYLITLLICMRLGTSHMASKENI